MTITTPLSYLFPSQPQAKSCCQKKLQAQKEMLQAIDTICRAALAALAIYLDAALFAYTFAIGTVAATAYTWYSLSVHNQGQEDGALKPFCGQGYMEFLSGKIFPAWTTHIVTTAFIGAHMRHDPQFFVPFGGLFIGWGAGCAIAEGAWDLSRRSMVWMKAHE